MGNPFKYHLVVFFVFIAFVMYILLPCVMVYYDVSGLFLMFFWCPCMAINVNVQYNGGLLPDIILLTQCYLHQGTFKCHEEILYLQPLIPPKRFDIFPPITGGRSRCTLIFL